MYEINSTIKRIEFPLSITKDYILKYVSQEAIFEKYLGIPVQFDRLICSPLRKDKSPTCGFRYSTSGALYLKDFSGHFWGNCFDMVMYLYNCSYNEALLIVAKDFDLDDATRMVNRELYVGYDMFKVPIKHYKKISIKVRAFSEDDMAYWKSFGIGKRVLRMYGVYPCENVFINDSVIYHYSKNDPAYAYRFGENEYKIYYPSRSKSQGRFNTNTTAIQGYDQLPDEGSLLVITKSMKDVMLLRQWNISAIAPQSEAADLPPELIKEMKSRFEKVVLLYDFDYAGVKFTNKARRRYNLPFIFLTNGKYGTEDFGAKDVSDYYQACGAPEFRALIQKAYLYGIKNY